MKARLRLGLLAAVAITAAAFASSALGQNYVVLYKAAFPANAAKTIAQGRWDARLQLPADRRRDRELDERVVPRQPAPGRQGSRTPRRRRLRDPARRTAAADGPPAGDLPNTPATDADTLSPLQWDMRQIHTPEAHAITGGSPAVLVGDIDTGIDFTHPDLAPNIDVGEQRQLRERRSGPGRRGAGRQRPRHAHRRHDRGGRATASGSSASRRT